MIRVSASLAAAAAFAFVTPALAQEVPSVAEHLCTFAGKCEGAKAESTGPSRSVGETRGFRLSRTAPSAAPARAGGSRNGAVAARMGAVGAASVAATQRRGDLRIGFALGSAEMTPVGVAAARNFAQAIQLSELSGARFAIEGHTDSLGTPAGNRDLSRRRAQAVADYLVGQGVARDRLEVQGFGAAQPMAGTRAANPSNRRVEALRLR